MNIEIKNFGPIDYLKIDLDKDLHLIYGKNAVGKSYVVEGLYCLLKNIDKFDRSFPNNTDNTKIYNFVNNELEEKLKTKRHIFTIVFMTHLKTSLVDFFQNSLQNTFSSLLNLSNRYNNESFELIITLSELSICEKISISQNKTNGIVDNIDVSFNNEKLNQYFSLEQFSNIPSSTQLSNEFLEKEGKNIITQFAFKSMETFREFTNKIREIHFLPASRSGLYQGLNSLSPIIAELSQHRLFISNNYIKLPTLPEPVSDYFLDISTLNKGLINEEFSEIVSLLENTILKGKVVIDEKTRNILYLPNELDIELSLSEASSMVSELSPLVLYLKHIINHKKTGEPFLDSIMDNRGVTQGIGSVSNQYCYLFIEEPESHLHPEIQVKLMKVFAELAKLNIKIFITSHSNYMFNELNNLILENKIDKERIAVYHLIHGENGTVQNSEMTVTEDGIYDENFQETSEKLYEERMRILEEAANA